MLYEFLSSLDTNTILERNYQKYLCTSCYSVSSYCLQIDHFLDSHIYHFCCHCHAINPTKIESDIYQCNCGSNLFISSEAKWCINCHHKYPKDYIPRHLIARQNQRQNNQVLNQYLDLPYKVKKREHSKKSNANKPIKKNNKSNNSIKARQNQFLLVTKFKQTEFCQPPIRNQSNKSNYLHKKKIT